MDLTLYSIISKSYDTKEKKRERSLVCCSYNIYHILPIIYNLGRFLISTEKWHSKPTSFRGRIRTVHLRGYQGSSSWSCRKPHIAQLRFWSMNRTHVQLIKMIWQKNIFCRWVLQCDIYLDIRSPKGEVVS